MDRAGMIAFQGIAFGQELMPPAESVDSAELLDRLRHSSAHVLAQAVCEMFPGTKLATGPAIDEGFYYDFEVPGGITEADLARVEARMREIVRADVPFEYREISEDEAKRLFADQPYKLELIDRILAGEIDEDGNPPKGQVVLSVYRHGEFQDLCRGPHVDRTGRILPDALKLLRIAGAYWQGDEHRPMLQRIYGTAWRTPEELKDYLWRVEEAKRRDATFVDLSDWLDRADPQWTENGLHLTAEGYRGTVEPLSRAFSLSAAEPDEKLRQAIVAKNELYFHRWRPQNVTYLFGFRKHEQGKNAREIPQFDPLVEEKEKEIRKLAVPVSHVYEVRPVR